MKIEGYRYRLEYDSITQTIHIIGDFREKRKSSLEDFASFLQKIYQEVKGALVFDFSKLHYINTSALMNLAEFFKQVSDDNRLKLTLNVTKIIDWQIRVLSKFEELPNVYIQVYDENFYEGQSVVESDYIVDVLRSQTRILWELEKDILVKHGLKKGMSVADVCCGCGDFTALIAKHMNVSAVTGYDHAEYSILQGRTQAKQFVLNNLDFFIADATSICVADNTFDFVTCRLSLQIFSQPQIILKELYRIVKPGGRVYVTCEDYDLIIAYPHREEISSLYRTLAEMAREAGADFYSGRKLASWLRDFKFEDIKVDILTTDTENTDRESLAKVFNTWKHLYCQTDDYADILKNANWSEQKITESRSNCIKQFDLQDSLIRHQGGYTNWSVIACSGTKPIVN